MSTKKKVLHLLTAGGVGGIESLSKDIARFSENDNLFCFVFSSGPITEEMKREGANVIELNIRSSKHFIKFFKMLSYICTKNRIEVIVTHHSAPLFYIAVRYLQFKNNIPYCVYMHSNIDHALLSTGKSIRSALFKFAAKKARCIICISKFVKKGVDYRFPFLKNRTTVIHNGVNLNEFKNNLNEQRECGIFTIIYVGRLIPEKGIDYLVKALSLLERMDKIMCLIVGDGPEKKKLEKLARELNLNEKIRFVGSQRNVYEWLKEASVFVHPAICEEGFGITLVEAMSTGLPCIAFYKGAIPEIIENKKSGFIVKDTTEVALAEAIDNAYNVSVNEVENWNKIQLNAVMQAEKFSIQSMVDQFDRVVSIGVD